MGHQSDARSSASSSQAEVIAEVEDFLRAQQTLEVEAQTLVSAGAAFREAVTRFAEALVEALIDIFEALAEFAEKLTQVFVKVQPPNRFVKQLRVEQLYRQLRSWYLPHFLAMILARWWVRFRR